MIAANVQLHIRTELSHAGANLNITFVLKVVSRAEDLSGVPLPRSLNRVRGKEGVGSAAMALTGAEEIPVGFDDQGRQIGSFMSPWSTGVCDDVVVVVVVVVVQLECALYVCVVSICNVQTTSVSQLVCASQL